MNATQAYAAHPHHGYMENHHPVQSSGPPYGHYAPAAPSLQPALGGHPPAQYGHHYYGYHNPVTSPQSANTQHHYAHQHQPSLPTPQTATPASQDYPQRTPDTTGQVAPPGVKPKVTATLWEDEGTLCFQVEDNGICVARRDDNHMINGTKLLNVANMTRGRRDGILKSEKIRNVVKIGPMHLKGVWIPFERALEFANKEKITERLYPLFVHNVGALLHQPTNQNAVMSRGRDGQNQTRYVATTQASQPPPLQHHHSMSNPVGSHVPQPPHSIAPHPSSGRPGLDRAHTFPTPPTSATSMMGMGNSGSSYEWSGPNQVPSSQALPMDSGAMANTRSMPTTPATTPPDQSVPHMHSGYHQQQQHPYDSSRMYAAPQPHQAHYGPSGHYGHPVDPYVKTDMAPPSSTASGHDTTHEAKDDGGEHLRYSQQHASSTYSGNQGYTYNTTQVSPSDVKGSPQQHSGRATPRTVATPQSQWQPGYGTPQRAQTLPSNSLSYVPGDPRATIANGTYAVPNGSGSNKRSRDDDDDEPYGRSGSASGVPESLKRQKTAREGSAGVSMGPGMNRARPAVVQRQ